MVHLELSVVVLIREVGEFVHGRVSFLTFHVCWAQLLVNELWWEVFNVVHRVKLWPVWWWQQLVRYFVPVDHVEPWVALDLFSVFRACSKSHAWVLNQKFMAKITRIWSQEIIIKIWLLVFYVLVKLLTILIVEWR